MTREQFKYRMETLWKWSKYIDSLADLGINIWERQEESDMVSEYTAMIEEAFYLDHFRNPLYGTPLDYYIYELHWGEDLSIHDFDEVGDYLINPFYDLDNLYDYFVKLKEEVENDKRTGNHADSEQTE